MEKQEEKPEFIYKPETKTAIFFSYCLFEEMRLKHNICADGLGTLINKQNQNEILGPPFAINIYQLTYLIDQVIYLRDFIEMTDVNDNEEIKEHQQNIDKNEDKVGNNVIDDSKVNKQQSNKHQIKNINTDDIINCRLSIIYQAFKYLTKTKNLYITNGMKFGSQFLAYEGDPLIYHSKYLVKILEQNQLSVQDLLVYERMANTIKKCLLILYPKNIQDQDLESDQIKFQCVQVNLSKQSNNNNNQ